MQLNPHACHPAEPQFATASGKAVTVSYPCVMLNTMVAQHNTNDQYATLVDPAAKTYEVSSRMTIEFEVDGPYKVRPAGGQRWSMVATSRQQLYMHIIHAHKLVCGEAIVC